MALTPIESVIRTVAFDHRIRARVKETLGRKLKRDKSLAAFAELIPHTELGTGRAFEGKQMEVINQPFSGQLGHRLIELLDSGDFHTLNIAVAFAKNSGVLRMKNAFETFRESGGTVNVFVGVDLGGTSYEALTTLLLHTDSLHVVHSEKSQTFHSKIYQFVGDAKGLLVVGSHNLTGGGLWTNFESSTLIPLEGSTASVAQIQGSMEDFFARLNSLGESIMSIGAQDDVESLLQNGYVIKEVAEQVRQSKAAKKAGAQERLFGYGVGAKLPHLPKPIGQGATTPSPAPTPTPATSALVPDEAIGRTIWFETRSMTGGSRNILVSDPKLS